MYDTDGKECMIKILRTACICAVIKRQLLSSVSLNQNIMKTMKIKFKLSQVQKCIKKAFIEINFGLIFLKNKNALIKFRKHRFFS